MNKILNLLSKQILLVKSEGITKVRYAKMIYLIFKGLVQGNILSSNELKFIRMPLGPVPDGFMDLYLDKDIILSEAQTGLSYNKQIYSLKNTNIEPVSYFAEITKIINKIDILSTSSLVEYTHSEPSWKTYPNGATYYIEDKDLARSLPHDGSKSPNDPERDNQLLQAYLIDGMIKEIVDESTALEYPDLKE